MSNVVPMFDQSKIQKCKETLIDQDCGSFIGKEDLNDTLRSLDKGLDKMSYEAPIDKNGKFNCTEFTHILKTGTQDKEDRQFLGFPVLRPHPSYLPHTCTLTCPCSVS
ncbi:Myosin regulatory light chain 12B [Lemmus lemmus]